MENTVNDYSDIIDDEAVRMQMADLEETIQLHEKAFFGQPRKVKYENFDFENSDMMKRYRENEDLLKGEVPPKFI